MSCQPCEERKQRLAALANEGTPLPARDWAFYAGWAIAATAVAWIAWGRVKGARA